MRVAGAIVHTDIIYSRSLVVVTGLIVRKVRRMARHNHKKKLSLGGLLLLIVIVFGARLLGIDLGSTTHNDQSTKTTTTTKPTIPTPSSQVEPTHETSQAPVDHRASTTHSDDDIIAHLVATQQSGVIVTVSGTVIKTLPDDNDGARHQRFLVKLTNGRTLLIAHNIDLADSVPVQQGDTIRIHGQFEYNNRGGVVHWTHHDPGGYHEDGWIEHMGTRYQ